MSEPEGMSQVVIWVPDGISHRHWVHRVQFVEGNFVLRQTSPAEIDGSAGCSGQGAETGEAVK